MKINRTLYLITFIQCFSFSCIKPEKVKNDSEAFVLSDSMQKKLEFDTADYKNLTMSMNLYGKITADYNKMIEVFPVVGGNVVSVKVELGDAVEKGQTLATIRSVEVAGYEKELLDAKSELLLAQNNLRVAQELFEGKLNTERDVIEARTQTEKAQSQLNRVEETYKIYNMRQGSMFEVRSPISGFVIQKNINQDMMLRSDRSDNIFDIAQLNDVWVIANVNESDIVRVNMGMKASITTLAYPGKIFEGHVDKIFNIIDPETKTMKVRVKLKNDEFLLKPEMRAIVQLFKEENEKMIAIQSKAVIFDNGKTYVMVYKSISQIETRQVNVYRQVGDVTYIDQGLKKGDVILSKSQLFIYDELND